MLLTGLAAGPAQAQEDAPLGTVTQTATTDAFDRALSNAKTQRDAVAADPAAEIVLSGTIALKDTDAAHPAPTGAAYRLRVENGAGTEIRTIATEAAFSLTLPGGEAYYLLASVDGDDSWYPTWFGDTPIDVEADGVGESRTDLTISLPRATAASGTVTASAASGVSTTSFVVQPYWYERETKAYYPFAEVRTSGIPGTADAWTTAQKALPAGEWVFRLAEPGYPSYDDQYFSNLPRLTGAAIVPVPAAGRTGVDFAPTAYQSEVGRLQGDDRIATAIAVTRSYFGDDLPVLYIASGEKWADALSAGPAAATQDGALLLTNRDDVPDILAAEITRLSPKRIVVVGDALSVSDAVYDRLATFAPTSRVAGSDRYDTSRKIVEGAFPTAGFGTVFLATGGNFPDALSVAPIAGRTDQPVLLVDGAQPGLDAPTRAAIDRLDAGRGQLIGGTGTISSGIESDLRASGLTGSVNRIAGKDRHDTSRLLNAAYPPSPLVDTAFLASATGFADALAAGPAAASIGAPLYLSEPNCVPVETRKAMQGQDLDRIFLLGSVRTLTADVASLRGC
ncbi:putative cell wall binding repeat protein [Rathayibacter sp. PhB179]|nr:putative cell wall binding repeat protein [Rathayibacter sp. PhB192]TCM28571.1 putative cell wall binding repeat protein [Rathayibacter sp. PhB179]